MENLSLPFTKHQLKIFVGSFLITFIVVVLQHFGLRIALPRLISPLQATKEDTLSALIPHLEQHRNTYTLKKPGNFIQPAFAETADVNKATAYAIIDFDSGEIISEKNGDSSVPIASLTKIMTATVALDLASADEKFTVTQRAADQIPTKIGVIPGQRYTLRELLHASLMTSANDAIEVIRDGIDAKYGDELFVRAMNKKAEIIGLKSTHFENPQGFDGKTHYSSAEDLAVLAHYALTNYPLISEIVKKDYIQFAANGDHNQVDLYNWNGLLGVYPNVSGVKIGNTEAAQKTTIVTAERGGKKLLVVVLGAPGIIERDLWAAELLDQGFEKELGLPPVNVTEEQLRAKYATWKYWN